MKCIDQLTKWDVLLESEEIAEAQYDNLKATVLEDIKHM